MTLRFSCSEEDDKVGCSQFEVRFKGSEVEVRVRFSEDDVNVTEVELGFWPSRISLTPLSCIVPFFVHVILSSQNPPQPF